MAKRKVKVPADPSPDKGLTLLEDYLRTKLEIEEEVVLGFSEFAMIKGSDALDNCDNIFLAAARAKEIKIFLGSLTSAREKGESADKRASRYLGRLDKEILDGARWPLRSTSVTSNYLYQVTLCARAELAVFMREFGVNNELVSSLYQALKAVEFGFSHTRCSACGGWNVSPNGETDFAHTPECPVNVALSMYEGKKSVKIHYKDRWPKKKALECA